jgi:hypothetical protein
MPIIRGFAMPANGKVAIAPVMAIKTGNCKGHFQLPGRRTSSSPARSTDASRWRCRIRKQLRSAGAGQPCFDDAALDQ